MTTLEKIRQTGEKISVASGIIGNKKSMEINVQQQIIDDFIEKLIIDFQEFNTSEQFDCSHLNLFNRAFMYVYGKGAEIAFFSRIGNSIMNITYEFDKAMQGISGEMLPDHFRFCLNRKSGVMLEMYFQMFQHTGDSQGELISEGLNFNHCISTILDVAFSCGVKISSTTELSNEDKQVVYKDRPDKLYDPDTYDQKYSINDYQVVNVNIIAS
jgi:hypothetical protein